jgi:hypothetical protein
LPVFHVLSEGSDEAEKGNVYREMFWKLESTRLSINLLMALMEHGDEIVT